VPAWPACRRRGRSPTISSMLLCSNATPSRSMPPSEPEHPRRVIRMGSSPVASRRSPSFFRDLSRTSPAPVRCRSGLASIFASRCPALILFPGGTIVSAVRFENGKGESETLAADLIVEASGRGNLTLGLLESTGQPLPEETVIGVDIGYATAVFAIPDNAPADWTAVMIFDPPAEGGLAGIMLPLERNRWIMTLVGHHGHKPPGDWDGFLAYAQQLRTRTIYNAIKGAERLGGVARFGFPASVRRHFDRLEKFPPGLLPFGDAICRFNPVYGQGMSVAAQEACLLRELLRRRGKETGPLDGLAPAFFAEAETLIETPWALAAIPDYAVPETEGDRPDDLEQTLEFGAGLVQLAATDAQVHKLWTEVLHLLKPQSVLRDPEIVERVKALAAQA